MKDIPLFQAQGGLATLFLSQIPHTGRAWVLLHSYDPASLEDVLAQCRSACRVCGATRGYVCFAEPEADIPSGLLHAYDLLELAGPNPTIPSNRAGQGPAPARPSPTIDQPLSLEPLTEQTAQAFADCYQAVFGALRHARVCRLADAKKLAVTGGAWLVRQSGVLVGLGQVRDSEIQALGLLPEFRGRGLGRALMRLLAGQIPADRVTVHTTSEDAPALGLYRSLGLTEVRPAERWYQLF